MNKKVIVKKSRLEKRRQKALSAIREQRSLIETMAQRPGSTEHAPDEQFLPKVQQRLSEIEDSAEKATNTDDLDDSIMFAEQQGQLRAYICPVAEIEYEANLVINILEEWGVPKTVTEKLRKSHVEKLQPQTDPQGARGALRSLFDEKDSWGDYTDDYEDVMKRYTWLLLPLAIILLFLAVICFDYAFCFSSLLVFGLLLAGAVGSIFSVLAKMPLLDVTLSAELEAYGRRIFSRVAMGVGASLIGCAFLGWGLVPISLQNQTFADALNSSLAGPGTSAAGIKTLILLGVPMLLGFSERALTSVEQRVFGSTKTVAKFD